MEEEPYDIINVWWLWYIRMDHPQTIMGVITMCPIILLRQDMGGLVSSHRCFHYQHKFSGNMMRLWCMIPITVCIFLGYCPISFSFFKWPPNTNNSDIIPSVAI